MFIDAYYVSGTEMCILWQWVILEELILIIASVLVHDNSSLRVDGRSGLQYCLSYLLPFSKDLSIIECQSWKICRNSNLVPSFYSSGVM